jgi:acyl-coenzyme A thioesterase PaaI-like protein
MTETNHSELAQAGDLHSHESRTPNKTMMPRRTLETMGFRPRQLADGWLCRPANAEGHFQDVLGEVHCRVDADGKARIRVFPTLAHSNFRGGLHGGFVLTLIDHVLFIGPAVLGIQKVLGGATIDIATQFFAPLLPEPVDAVIEVMRETGRLVFTRGVIEQNGVIAAAFSATTKKLSDKAVV